MVKQLLKAFSVKYAKLLDLYFVQLQSAWVSIDEKITDICIPFE